MTPDAWQDPFFKPRTIAILGASRKDGSIGNRVLRNLLEGGFTGTVYPVNPNSPSVNAVKAYPSVKDIPDEVDLAIVLVPARFVTGALKECAEKKVKAVVIMSAGFREAGAEGAVREKEVEKILEDASFRIIGPNCMGISNGHPDVRMNATFSPEDPGHGNIAFVSQSGALGIAVLARATELGLGLHNFVSLGNRVDVSSNDLLEVWENDDDVEVVMLYLEHFGNPRRFVDVARRLSRKKPILAIKSGRSPQGAKATASHTGSLAEDDVWSAALFEQCGILRAHTMSELFHLAQVFAKAVPPTGRRLAILTNSGGPGVLATDAAFEYGLEVPTLSKELQARIQEHAVQEASVRNPIDLTGSHTPEAYKDILEMLLESDEVDAVLTIYTPPGHVDNDAVVHNILAPDRSKKPVLACVLGSGRLEGSPFHALTRSGLPTFSFPESAVRALSRYVSWEEMRHQPMGSVPRLDVDRDAVADILADQAEDWVDAEGLHDILSAYGIPVPKQTIVDSPAACANALEGMGGQVVLKAIAPGLVHKSDAGGVVVGVGDGDAAMQAYQDMCERVKEAGYDMTGALVQQQKPLGHEVVIGATVDPNFGPMVMFGLGGIHVEILKDVVFRLAPLTDEEAKRMVRAIRAWPLLEGVRGKPPADVAALEDILLRVSQLVADQPAIRELDLNPVFVGRDGHGAWAVDARIRLWPDGHAPRAPTVVTEVQGA